MSNFVQPHGQQPISLLRPQDSLGKNTGEGCNSFSNDQPRKHIKKQRLYFTNKGLSSQNYGFPVVIHGCESWIIKKAEHQIIDAFELCWIRLLRVPWTVRRSNQSILKESSPEYSLEGLMLKLKLHYFGHLM